MSPSAAGAAHAAQATKSEQSAQSTKSKQSKKSKTNEQSEQSEKNAKKKHRGARRPPGHAEEDLTMHMMGVFADAELEADAAALYAVSDDGGMRYYHSGGEFASDGEGF